ncbi:MAG: glutamine--tRNA ligase, partial [Treponema sp.]|nr:glutamine--tRNA ligase [Treponema sp.]
TSRRVMAVLRPLKLIVENWPEGTSEDLQAVNNPEDESAGTRIIRFGKELWIERDDFEENPPPKYFRLFPGNAVRLRYGYVVTCTGCDKDSAGNVTTVRCRYDPATKGGNAPDNRKIKGTIHWLNAAEAIPLEARVYDYLFAVDKPMEAPVKADGRAGSFLDNLNPGSLERIAGAYGEPCLGTATPGDRFQFERLGYFARDPDHVEGKPVFNKTVGLRDTWARIVKKA